MKCCPPRIQLTKEVAQLSEHQTIRSNPSRAEAIPLELRESILSTKDSMSRPPKPADITEDAIQIPDTYITLLYLPSDFRVAYAANISEHLAIRREMTTTPGTTSPTLFEQCVGSFTSHRINYEE